MRLNEFLENTIPAYKLKDVLYKNDGLTIEYLTDPEHNYGVSSFYIDKDSLYEELSSKNIKISEFDTIIQKYGWYISFVRGNKVSLLKLNGYDNGYYDVTGAFFNGLYLHISNVKPSEIKSAGLLSKDSKDYKLDNSGVMHRGILYPDRRVYLWKLSDAFGNLMQSATEFEKRAIAVFKTILRSLDANSYGTYMYLVRLPEGLRTHYDQEYGPDNPARYVTQNIPPSYVKYIGTTDRIEEVIRAGDFKRFRQILGI